jgi:hypothetical protein
MGTAAIGAEPRGWAQDLTYCATSVMQIAVLKFARDNVKNWFEFAMNQCSNLVGRKGLVRAFHERFQ